MQFGTSERASKHANDNQTNQQTNETMGKRMIRACVMCTYHMVRLCGSWVIYAFNVRPCNCVVVYVTPYSVQFSCVVLQFKELFVEKVAVHYVDRLCQCIYMHIQKT